MRVRKRSLVFSLFAVGLSSTRRTWTASKLGTGFSSAIVFVLVIVVVVVLLLRSALRSDAEILIGLQLIRAPKFSRFAVIQACWIKLRAGAV